jgi:hypothetical protein
MPWTGPIHGIRTRRGLGNVDPQGRRVGRPRQPYLLPLTVLSGQGGLEGFGYRFVLDADLNQVALDVRRGDLLHTMKREAGLEETDGGVGPVFGGVEAVKILEIVVRSPVVAKFPVFWRVKGGSPFEMFVRARQVDQHGDDVDRVAVSGPLATSRITSAIPPKADILRAVAKSLLMTQSGRLLNCPTYIFLHQN